MVSEIQGVSVFGYFPHKYIILYTYLIYDNYAIFNIKLNNINTLLFTF